MLEGSAVSPPIALDSASALSERVSCRERRGATKALEREAEERQAEERQADRHLPRSTLELRDGGGCDVQNSFAVQRCADCLSCGGRRCTSPNARKRHSEPGIR